MFFGRKLRKTRGIELINEVVGRFSTIVDELDEGVADCRSEQSGISVQVDMLRQRDADLSASVNKASGVASKLRSLIGE